MSLTTKKKIEPWGIRCCGPVEPDHIISSFALMQKSMKLCHYCFLNGKSPSKPMVKTMVGSILQDIQHSIQNGGVAGHAFPFLLFVAAAELDLVGNALFKKYSQQYWSRYH
jgi:hypothetical protein